MCDIPKINHIILLKVKQLKLVNGFPSGVDAFSFRRSNLFETRKFNYIHILSSVYRFLKQNIIVVGVVPSECTASNIVLYFCCDIRLCVHNLFYFVSFLFSPLSFSVLFPGLRATCFWSVATARMIGMSRKNNSTLFRGDVLGWFWYVSIFVMLLLRFIKRSD